MNTIQIKTGSNISKLLQSTVTVPQAFTELVKNSIQNFATFTDIKLHKDYAEIIDDGQGFDHKKDSSGMNSFDKYFVFGNSYDTTDGQGIRLGQMGIGGKLSNDKLSHAQNIHWQIETKNKHGKCYLIDYKPGKVEFLDDYAPSIKNISPSKCSIKSKTGTKIKILTLKETIKKDGWNLQEIKSELNTFFGFLVPQLQKQGKNYKIFVNDQSLDFSYKLPGSNIPTFNRFFKYDFYGKTQNAHLELRMSIVNDRKMIQNHPLKNIEIISDVKICSFNLSDKDLALKHFNKIKNKPKNIEFEKVYSVFNKLIGFASCSHLSSVLDDTGMPAKDLSHHGLRSDHPLTKPFYDCLYDIVINWIVTYLILQEDKKQDEANALTSRVCDILTNFFVNNSFKDIENLLDDFDGSTDEDQEIKDAARQAAANAHEFDPEPEDKDKKPPNKDNNFWKKYGNIPQKQKRIRHQVIRFPNDEKFMMSKMDEADDPFVAINSNNPKYQAMLSQESPFLLSLHVSESFIREIMVYNDPMIKHSEIDKKISLFYAANFKQLFNLTN